MCRFAEALEPFYHRIKLMVGGSVDLCDVDGVTLTIVSPLAASTTPTGTSKDTYRVNEDVYAAGSG
ncbi:MAG: hypothetical protein KAR25_05075, partial [Methanosarcinales archaeon]|nr:hypothetical protein [Methanosarcinales archaeon]